MITKNKIVLGTAQFGMNYGINNKKGKIPKKEAFKILNEAIHHNINIIDTANVYGESELVIGEFIKKHKNEFKVISKCASKDVKIIFNCSAKQLNLDKLYGFMIHDFQYYIQNPEILDNLRELKSEGKIKKIGMSLYFPHELIYLFKNKIDIDIIQVPYNVFDQRFEQYFSEIKNKDIELYVRSVFLQGLLFKNPSELSEHFTKIKEKIEHLNSLSTELNIPLVSLYLNFTVLNEYIDKVIVGVDSIENFKEIISSEKYIDSVKDILPELYKLKENDENIILPTKWRD